jgi:hypothetical protein
MNGAAFYLLMATAAWIEANALHGLPAARPGWAI